MYERPAPPWRGEGGGAFAAFPKQTDKCPTNTWRELGEGGEEGKGGRRGGEGEVWARPHVRAVDLKRGISSSKHLSRMQTRA